MKKTFLFILGLAGVLLVSRDAEAHSPRAREIVAVVQTINYDKRMLVLIYPQGRGPRELVWNSETTFLHDLKVVPATELKKDLRVTIYYHSPFFGKPFITKAVW